jgi:hypothetical protein
LAALRAYIHGYRLENKNPSDQAKALGLAWDLFRSFKSFPYEPKQDAAERAFVKEVLVDSLSKTLLIRMKEIDCERRLDSIERPNSIGPRYTEAEIRDRRKMLRALRQQLEVIVDRAVESSASVVTSNGSYRIVPSPLEQLTELPPRYARRIPELCERICAKVEERLDAGKADLVTKGELATLLLTLTPRHDVGLVTKRLARLDKPLLRDGDAVLLDTTIPGPFNPIRRADPNAKNPPATLMIPSMALSPCGFSSESWSPNRG